RSVDSGRSVRGFPVARRTAGHTDSRTGGAWGWFLDRGSLPQQWALSGGYHPAASLAKFRPPWPDTGPTRQRGTAAYYPGTKDGPVGRLSRAVRLRDKGSGRLWRAVPRD